jgi:hypothetical protein
LPKFAQTFPCFAFDDFYLPHPHRKYFELHGVENRLILRGVRVVAEKKLQLAGPLLHVMPSNF